MTSGDRRFFIACSTGKAQSVLAQLDTGVDPDARDENGLTGLIWAGRKGQVEVARLLLEHGADLDGTDPRGRTALFHAVGYQRYDFVRFMAASGANLSPVDVYGWTPLGFSVVSHHRKMEALLRELGAVSARGSA